METLACGPTPGPGGLVCLHGCFKTMYGGGPAQGKAWARFIFAGDLGASARHALETPSDLLYAGLYRS
jgi:hypothetical protein